MTREDTTGAATTGAATTGTSDGTKLRRVVTGPMLFLFVLGDVLGAGVYALMGVLAAEVGGATWVPMVVALGLALLTAGSYAELVTKYPRAGGSAYFAEKAYKKPVVSFLVGFSMLSAGVVSVAGLSLAFAGDYLANFVPIAPPVAAIGLIAVLALVNMWGIRESMTGNIVMTIIEVSGLVLIVVAVGLMLGGGGGDVSRVGQFPEGVNPALATLAAAIIAYYSFVGFETSANVAEELKNPSRSYPIALLGSLAVAGIVYVLVAMASAIALPPEELSESSGPLLAVFEATGVPLPTVIFSIIALIAIANGALLTSIMSSRLAYGMADRGLLPRALTRVLPGRRTPWVAIVVTAAIAALLTLLGDLATLAETVVLLLLVVFISTNVAVLVLRRDTVEHKHFRVWTWVPVAGVLSCILLLTQQSPQVWLFGAIALAIGLVLYLVMRAVGGRSRRTDASASADSEG
jgi:amino acid transporter